MKSRRSSKSENERAIFMGYLWRWGSVALILLLPVFTYGICVFWGALPKTQQFCTMLAFGIGMLGMGAYEIIGSVLEFRHLLVSLQLTVHIPKDKLNSTRAWTKQDKKDGIGIGIIFAFWGTAMIIVTMLGWGGIFS